MFNNFINIHDFTRVLWGLKHGYLPKIISRLSKGKAGRVKETWKIVPQKPSSWWVIPEVGRHYNYLMTGDENSGYYEYVSKKYFSDKNQLTGLSLGCGSGHRERKWVGLCDFRRIDGYDISPSLIEAAKESAEKQGLSETISYHAADIYSAGLEQNCYDAVFVEQALHHFSPLEQLLVDINRSLKPDGYFIVNEFVGPSRFQWTDRQLEIVNAIKSILPEKYKQHVVDGSTTKKIIRPSRLSMILKDPSEAIESEKIMGLLNQIFDVIELRPYYGTVTHLLFDGIAHNFLGDDDETRKYIRMCLEIEEILIETGQIESDYVLVICKKKM